jgi:uncharacterized protein (DUF433 family)
MFLIRVRFAESMFCEPSFFHKRPFPRIAPPVGRVVALAKADESRPSVSEHEFVLSLSAFPLCASRFPSFPMSKNRPDYTPPQIRCPAKLSLCDRRAILCSGAGVSPVCPTRSAPDFYPERFRGPTAPPSLPRLHHCFSAVFAQTKNVKKKLITSDPEIMGGTPCFTGTRVPVQTLMDYLEAGDSIDEFLDGFPTVKRVQVIAILPVAAPFRVRPPCRRDQVVLVIAL